MTISAPEDSRLDVGVLTLGGTAHTKQISSVELEPAVETKGDTLELLSGHTLAPQESTKWALKLGYVQDFDDPDGLLEYLRAHAGEEVPFTWEPNDAGPAFSGHVTVRAGKYGGNVRVRLTSSVDLPVTELDDPDYD